MSNGDMLYREPSDYEQGAGGKFQRGNIVSFYENKEIGIVIHCPGLLTDKNSDRWENFYNVELIDGGYLSHRHIHESDIKICDGILDKNNEFLTVYSDFLKGNINEDSDYWQKLKLFANERNIKTEYE